MARPHYSLRLDDSLMERVKSLKQDEEPLSETYRRVLVVGCETLESDTDGARNGANGAQGNTRATAGARDDAQNGAHGDTLLISVLQAEIARLEAEHEADRAAIKAKDAQLARALEKSQELTEQAHILMGMNTRADSLPAAQIVDDEQETETEIETETVEQPEPEAQKGFFARLFGL